MLYSPQQFNRDQLLADLLAAKALIDTPEKWVQGAFKIKGGFKTEGGIKSLYEEAHCIIGACHAVTGHKITHFQCVYADKITAIDVRLGRMVKVLMETLRGKELSNQTVWATEKQIAAFNDSEQVTHEAVMLLFDRAIARLMELSMVDAGLADSAEGLGG